MDNTAIERVDNNKINNSLVDSVLLSGKINNVAPPPPVKDCSYVFVVISTLNEIGIEKSSKILAAIAQVQKILDEIITDLSQLKNLLQQLQNIGWGNEPGKDTPWDPSKHTDQDNQARMSWRIQEWLDRTTTNPFTGKDCSNSELLQAYWQDIYAAPAAGGGGLLFKLQEALDNPDFPQKQGSAFTFLKDLNDPDKFSGGKGDWVLNKRSFLDFLNGKVEAGDTIYIADIMTKGFTYSWYNRTGQDPSGETKTYNDDVGDITNQFEQTKQSLNGLNTTQSSSLSMYSQNLTSYIQEGQQMIQNGSQETKAYVSNQKGQ